MNLVYVSPQYQVVEYAGERGGFELINRQLGVGTYLRGEMADKFRRSLSDVFQEEPTEELVDEFLGNFDELMRQPAVFH
ncbi:MAG: DUF3567 family protein [Burkholderiales bacterium]|nr:DUF3567 family protein [Burkholderiales bacterium]